MKLKDSEGKAVKFSRPRSSVCNQLYSIGHLRMNGGMCASCAFYAKKGVKDGSTKPAD